MADDEELIHYGTPRHSGRYPWGSGQTPFESSKSFLGYTNDLKAKGVSEAEIAKGLGLETTTKLRALKSIAKNESRNADAAQALRLKNKGLTNVAIGKRMGGINESVVRELLKPATQDKLDILTTTTNLLRDKVGEDRYLDIGSGTENHLGISATRLSTAVAVLREEGYQVRNIQVPQLGTNNKTTVKVLVPPDAPRFIDPEKIQTVASYSEDGGRTQTPIKPPVNVDSKRISVRYAEQGGANADGVIYVRPGVPDVSLGAARYAQVRIAVDGTHYLKGMAMYKDDLPEGTDLQFNTNKSDTGNKLDAMKKQDDKDDTNPFGAVIHQKTYLGKDGKLHQSPMNIVNEEGDWKDWSRSLSSQVLSKQSPALATRQLALALASRRDELDEISKLTNPVVKKKLLDSFADGADSASVHLKAAALPGQGTHVILPVETLKENEVYAPNYRNGQRVALVRFPHGGTFEIPEVVVNNKHPDARALIGGSGTDKDGRVVGGAVDAIGIHPKVAARLSGADFDGDTVLVIPNDRKAVKSTPPLEGLKNFDPQQAYPKYEGMTPMSARAKQQQMGDVSNLITDMTIKGANPDEIAAAVRHSMVVIDAEKHVLNYKQSYIDNGIASLKAKYQGRGSTGRLKGASTLISRSGNTTVLVDQKRLRKASEGRSVDPLTGKKVFVKTNASYVDSKGSTIVEKTRSKPLLETDDAHTLVSESGGTPIENIYADHSNALKALANDARKESLSTGTLHYSPTAKQTYAAEVAHLNASLNTALKNRPLERQAQLIGNSIWQAKLRDNPEMDNADLKKIKGQALLTARARIGAGKDKIQISEKEWEAIQAGAISANKLSQILDNANADRIRELATPRAAVEITPSKLALAKARLASGYTQKEIADSLGIPVSTLNSALRREGG